MSEEKFIGGIKVMRSYDYCHFEVQLASSEPMFLHEVDNMRKEAARLADKAVFQYQTAKAALQKRAYTENDISHLRRRVESIREIPEAEWTPEQKAAVKRMADLDFHMSREYDYQDDWDDEWDE